MTKGPASALYGSDAIGGMINASTRAPSATPQGDFSLEAGAYGWGRLLATASNSWGGSGLRADLNGFRAPSRVVDGQVRRRDRGIRPLG